MRPPPFAALQRAHGMDRQAGNRRELLLREARRLAERFELRAKRPGSARFHGPFILLPRLYGRRTSPVRVLSVVVAACDAATLVGMAGDDEGDRVCHGSRRIHRHGVDQGARGPRPSGVRSRAFAGGGASACAVPARSPSWAICSSPVSGRTRRPPTGCSICRRTRCAGGASRGGAPTRSPAIARSMDAHLLDAVAAGSTRRIVYVADTSCYGATGMRADHRGRTAAALRLGTLPHARARSPRRLRRRRDCRSSPRFPDGSTATRRGFANASSTR